jgi:hypothetical protein
VGFPLLSLTQIGLKHLATISAEADRAGFFSCPKNLVEKGMI